MRRAKLEVDRASSQVTLAAAATILPRSRKGEPDGWKLEGHDANETRFRVMESVEGEKLAQRPKKWRLRR